MPYQKSRRGQRPGAAGARAARPASGRGSPQLRAFANGRRVGTATSALAIPYTGTDLFLGGDSAGAAACRGSIGPVFVWNYVLTDTQMLQFQQVARARFEGLLGQPPPLGFVAGGGGARGSFLPFFAPSP
jgi:hypothetical protein